MNKKIFLSFSSKMMYIFVRLITFIIFISYYFMAKKLTYEEALSQIEEIVKNIEENKYSIDELGEQVKKISFLVNFCKEKLKVSKEQLDKIISET